MIKSLLIELRIPIPRHFELGIRAMSFLKEKDDDPKPSDENRDFEIEFSENEKGFQGNFLISQEILSKIKSLKLDIKKEKIFNIPRAPFGLNILNRKNNIFYFVSTKEMHVDIKDTKGSVFLSLLNREEIKKNLLKIDAKIRSTISTVHLGAVKILLKSEFQEGIDSPIKMALIDNRIKDRKDCILGAARGNLAYQKFMFSVYPKFGLALDTRNLDTVLSFVHHFERENLMDAGDKVFSISYVVAYALTNSVHSIDYKKSEYIELEDVFSDIGSIEEKQFSDISPLETSWAIDIARNKPHLGEKPRMSFRGKELFVGESSTTDNLLRNVSTRIDKLSQKLELLS